MKEFKYIEAVNGGSFTNMDCTMTRTMDVEFTFLTYDYPDSTVESQGSFFTLGGNGGDVVLRGEDQHQYWYSGGGDWVVSDYWTLNEVHTATWNSQVWTFDEYSHNTTSGCYQGAQVLKIVSQGCGVRIYGVKVTDGGVVVNEFVGAENNGVIGLWDKTNDVFYTPTYGTWVGVSDFIPSEDTFTFNANGGTETFTVTADNSWTCTTPSNFTISPMSGSAGETTVTITAPSRLSTVSNTVTFTDSQSNTFGITISQSAGTENPNLTMYRNGNAVKKMYHNGSLVYRKMSETPTLTVSSNSLNLPFEGGSDTVTITSSAEWSATTATEWLTITETSGGITVTATSASSDRTATITVTASNGFFTKTETITVIQQNIQTIDYVTTEYSTGPETCINTGIYPTIDTVFKVKYKPNSSNGGCLVGFAPPDGTPICSADDDTDYRFFNAWGSESVFFDFNADRVNSFSFATADADGYVTIECGNNYVTDINSSNTLTGATQSSMATTGVPIYLNLCSNAWVQSLEIWQGDTKVYDGYAANNGTDYGWYDSISSTFTTQTYGGYTITGE